MRHELPQLALAFTLVAVVGALTILVSPWLYFVVVGAWVLYELAGSRDDD